MTSQTFYIVGWLVYVITVLSAAILVSGRSRGRARRGLRVTGRVIDGWMTSIWWLLSNIRCRCIPWNAPVGARHTKESHRHDCTPTPPCGGCSRCISQQYWYYAERNKINVRSRLHL